MAGRGADGILVCIFKGIRRRLDCFFLFRCGPERGEEGICIRLIPNTPVVFIDLAPGKQAGRTYANGREEGVQIQRGDSVAARMYVAAMKRHWSFLRSLCFGLNVVRWWVVPCLIWCALEDGATGGDVLRFQGAIIFLRVAASLAVGTPDICG